MADTRVASVDYDLLMAAVSNTLYVFLQVWSDENKDNLLAVADQLQSLRKEAYKVGPTTVNTPPWAIENLDKAAAFPSVDKT